MANIVNAIRNLSSDSWWFIKVLVLAAPIFYFFENTSPATFDFNSFLPYFVVFSILYLGFASVMMHRNIQNKAPLMPSLFSLPEFIVKSIGISIVSLPMYILYFMAMSFVYNTVELETYLMVIIYVAVTLLFAPFIYIPSVLYSVNGKLTEAFNFKIIFECGGNFCVQFLAFLLQYVFTIFLVTLLFFHWFKNMLEDPLLLNITVSLSIVISFLTLYSYCADMYGDVIAQLPEKKKKKKTIVVDS